MDKIAQPKKEKQIGVRIKQQEYRQLMEIKDKVSPLIPDAEIFRVALGFYIAAVKLWGVDSNTLKPHPCKCTKKYPVGAY